jgi:hypothetical protein
VGGGYRQYYDYGLIAETWRRKERAEKDASKCMGRLHVRWAGMQLGLTQDEAPKALRLRQLPHTELVIPAQVGIQGMEFWIRLSPECG